MKVRDVQAFVARGRRAQAAVDRVLPKRKPRQRACAVCGCTDDHACVPHGCMWITKRPPLCSGCFAFFMNIRDDAKLAAALVHFGLDPSVLKG